MKSFIFYSLLFAFFIPSYSFAKDCSKEYKAMKQARAILKQASDKEDKAITRLKQALDKEKQARIKEDKAFSRLRPARDNQQYRQAHLNWEQACNKKDESRVKWWQAYDKWMQDRDKYREAVKMYNSCNQSLSE